MEENNSEIVQEAPETRGPSDAAARRKRRLIVGLVLGAALCAALAAAAAAVLGSPARVLAGAWKNTATVLEARSGAQPLGVAAEAIRNGKSGRRFTLSGGAGEQKGALTVTAGDGRLAARAELTADGGTTDLSAYYGTEFAGIASRALFGGDTAYGAKPGSFAEEAKGGIFDPVSGEYPMNAETLRELDALLGGGQTPDAGSGKETAERLSEELRGFLRSVKGKKSSGTAPDVGGKATILTYVYPADRTIELLQTMSDTFFDGAGASFGGAGGTASDARTLRQRCDAAIDGLRKNYAGDVTVQYYIREKKVICLRVEAEPSYRGEAFRCALDVDFGMSTGVLKAKTSVSGKGESVEAAATSGQTFRDGVAEDKWDLSVREDGSETLRLSGGSVWNSESGAYRASADAHDGEKSYAVSAEGTLKIGKADFELSLDKISDTDWAGGTHVFAAGVKYESGVEVPEPSGEKNLFKLTSDEFLALAASSAGKAAPLYGALTGGLGSGSQLP